MCVYINSTYKTWIIITINIILFLEYIYTHKTFASFNCSF